MRPRIPSPATIIASVALFVALGGTALAASHYIITSTSQIKPSVLRSLRGKAGLRGPAGAAGPAGTPGAAGAAGPKGAEGPAGPTRLSTLTEVEGPQEPLSEIQNTNLSVAECPSGESAISGGAYTSEPDHLTGSYATGSMTGWVAEGAVNSPTSEERGFVLAWAYCAKSGQAVAAK